MPGMRLLDRYLLRGLFVPLAYCLGGFLIFYVAFDLIFRMNSFQERHLSPGDIAEYYVVTLPEILVTIVIPVSLLLALLYALTNHNRHNELTAMRTSGVSLWRLSLPYFGVGVLSGLVVLAMNELLVPPSDDRAEEIKHRHDANAADRVWIRKLQLDNQAEGRHWSIDRYNRATGEMIAPLVQWERADGSSHYITADRGIYTNGQWVFFNVEGWVYTDGQWVLSNVEDWVRMTGSPTNLNPLPGDRKPRAVLALTLSETPAWIKSELKVRALSPEEAARKPELSIREIRTYLRLHPRLEKADRAKLMTQFQCRLAEPFTCLTVVLIALPFGMRAGRQNVFAAVAGSLFICFAYFIMQRIAMGLGVGGTLPPFLAAWLPNLLFGLTGLVLLWRTR
ncbi:MAG: LptF/LptG family permease [Verrucomicrobiota bacterium]|jgi:lipopolysaccharide export system permease protein